jgi:hypothetical protein
MHFFVGFINVSDFVMLFNPVLFCDFNVTKWMQRSEAETGVQQTYEETGVLLGFVFYSILLLLQEFTYSHNPVQELN